MHVIAIQTHQVPCKSRRQADAIVFELRANRKITSQIADVWEKVPPYRKSGGIRSRISGSLPCFPFLKSLLVFIEAETSVLHIAACLAQYHSRSRTHSSSSSLQPEYIQMRLMGSDSTISPPRMIISWPKQFDVSHHENLNSCCGNMVSSVFIIGIGGVHAVVRDRNVSVFTSQEGSNHAFFGAPNLHYAS